MRLVKVADEASDRSVSATKLTLTGAALGGALGGAKAHDRLGLGNAIGQRIQSIKDRRKSLTAVGSTERAFMKRLSKHRWNHPKSIPTLKGVGRGALIGGAIGLAGGITANELLKKEGSMGRLVLVKEGYDYGHEVREETARTKTRQHAKPVGWGKAVGVGSAIGAGLGAGVGALTGRSGTRGVRALAGAGIGAGVGALGGGIYGAGDRMDISESKHVQKMKPTQRREYLAHKARRDEHSEQWWTDERRHQSLMHKESSEKLADELDMVSDDPQFLREAPLFEEPGIELPYLPRGLVFNEGGVKIAAARPPADEDDSERWTDEVCAGLLKIAAVSKAPAMSTQLNLPRFGEGYMVLPAPTGAMAAAHEAAKSTAVGSHVPLKSPSFGESMASAGKNLWGNTKSILMGTGEVTPHGKAQAALAVALIGGAALGLRHVYKKRQTQAHYDRVLGGVMEDPHFANVEMKEDRVPEAYGFLRRYAPTLAMDPSIARAFVRQAIESDVSFMNTTVAQGLATAEREHLESTRTKRELQDVMTHPYIAPFTGGGGKGGGGGKKK